MKTILHLSPLAAVGGCEVNCLRIIEGLPHYKHHVVVFDDRGPMSDQWEGAGARVDHLAAWRLGRRSFQLAFARWMTSQIEPEGIFCGSTSRLRTVLEVLKGWKMPWSIYLGNPVANGLVSQIRRWMWERLDKVPSSMTLVACSSCVAVSHRNALYFRRFPIKVIYNAVAPKFDRPHEYRLLKEGSVPRIGMVARLDSIKDHMTLIRALSALRSDVIVEFAGDGHMREKLEREAHLLGVADRVRFLGFTEVDPLLRIWDIYVHSTTAAEGMGTAVAEAMMAGLPCVVSDLAVMREVCGSDGADYFHAGAPDSLGRALIKLLADRDRRESLGRAGQRRARWMFARTQVAEAYLQLVSPLTAKEFA